MIDKDGFRIGVGIIMINQFCDVLWARRIRQGTWQFPQGGVQEGEVPEEALYRELYEELGLKKADVELIGGTRSWLHYWLPIRLRRLSSTPVCVGQKQKWFLLRLIEDEKKICFNLTDSPEFDRWRWVRYWYPIRQAIAFKRHVYRRALEELAMFVPEVLQQNRARDWKSKMLETEYVKKHEHDHA